MNSTLYKNPITDSLKKALLGEPAKELMTDFKGRSLKGKEIFDSIEKIAILLADTGLKKNDRVVFLAQPSIESILYFFALIRVGACIVLADPEMGQENFVERVTFSKATWLLQDPILEKVERYSFVKPLLRFFKIWFPEQLPIQKDKRIPIEPLSTILTRDISKYTSVTNSIARTDINIISAGNHRVANHAANRCSRRGLIGTISSAFIAIENIC